MCADACRAAQFQRLVREIAKNMKISAFSRAHPRPMIYVGHAEFMHLKFNHAISYRRMAQMSSDKVPGIPPHLKDKKQPCEICQHANITRQVPVPVRLRFTCHQCHTPTSSLDSIE